MIIIMMKIIIIEKQLTLNDDASNLNITVLLVGLAEVWLVVIILYFSTSFHKV